MVEGIHDFQNSLGIGENSVWRPGPPYLLLPVPLWARLLLVSSSLTAAEPHRCLCFSWGQGHHCLRSFLRLGPLPRTLTPQMHSELPSSGFCSDSHPPSQWSLLWHSHLTFQPPPYPSPSLECLLCLFLSAPSPSTVWIQGTGPQERAESQGGTCAGLACSQWRTILSSHCIVEAFCISLLYPVPREFPSCGQGDGALPQGCLKFPRSFRSVSSREHQGSGSSISEDPKQSLIRREVWALGLDQAMVGVLKGRSVQLSSPLQLMWGLHQEGSEFWIKGSKKSLVGLCVAVYCPWIPPVAVGSRRMSLHHDVLPVWVSVLTLSINK